MNIAIIDADLIGRKNHRFPNLAAMKISGYHKQLGDNVILKMDYDNLNDYDRVYISKVFIDTELPFESNDKTLKTEDTVYEYYKNHPFFNTSNIICGGTGFYYDKSPRLDENIEHSMPDYHLYDGYVSEQIKKGKPKYDFKYYTDYSIGFTTRGCIRGCSFCVNKNYKLCDKHSSVYEWLDKSRPYICCLDDNVFACKDWKEIFNELQATGKPFQYKQGLDERLLTNEKCVELFCNSKLIGDCIFAFDSILDKDLIESKLKLIRKYTDRQLKFYVLCGYNTREDEYSDDFWQQDINDTFERIDILAKYNCIPYIMRHKNHYLSPYKGLYTTIASWCNQPSFFRRMSFSTFSKARGMSTGMYKIYKTDFDKYIADGHSKCASWQYLEKFESDRPDIAEKYFYNVYNNKEI